MFIFRCNRGQRPPPASQGREAAGGVGSLTAARRSGIRHAAWLNAIVDSHELRLASGQELDVGAYTQALNSLLGLFRARHSVLARLIGAEDAARVENIRSWLAANEHRANAKHR